MSRGGDTITVKPHDERLRRSYYLLVLHGGSSSVFHLPRTGAVVIGRGEDVELRLGDSGVSREHAVLTLADDTARIADLGSHNGTWVNGARIAGPTTLISGDEVRIGESALVVHASGEVPNRRPADLGELRARLQEEIQRCLLHRRCLGVIALAPGVPATARAAIDAAKGDAVGALGLAVWDDEGRLLVLLPEARAHEVAATASTLVSALAPKWQGVRAGFATSPADGCDGDTLISMARSAAAAGETGSARAAGEAATVLTLGDRTVVLAEPATIRLFELVRRLASSDVPVLIAGETGVGKDSAAFGIHVWSPRARRPFVTLNCAAIPETLVESELFGHEKGAFSGATASKPGMLESADGGTLFLDEIGDLSPAAQGKLLRAIEAKRIVRLGDTRERKIDIRIVAATNRDLAADVRSGRFRQDLFFRLGVATVLLPPLRDRPREVPILARTFLADARARAGRPPMAISATVMQSLATHAWTGNVRELKHVMEYVAAAADGDTVELAHLPEGIATRPAGADDDASRAAETTPFRSLADELRELERTRIAQAIDAAGGYQNRAAELLGMPLRTFYQKVKQYGLGMRSRSRPDS